MKKVALLTSLVASAFLLTKCNSPKVETTPVAQNPWTNTNTLDSMAEAGINPDSVDFSFVFMGCNRIDSQYVCVDTGGTKSKECFAATNATTANVFHLKRTFNEVCAMKIKPKFFFFLGDLVLGLDTTGVSLKNQLNAWVQQFQSDTFSNMPNSGIRLVAIPGNHEMLYKVKYNSTWKKEELPLAIAPRIWRSIMQAFSIQAPDDYGLSYCQQDSLSYSFNYKGTHFVMLNTDMYVPGHPDSVGVIPAPWVAADVAAAHTNQAKHIFVMGHKPSYIIYGGKLTKAHAATTDDIIDTNSTNIMWPALKANQVEGMLTAHRHEFLVTQPDSGKTTQIIAGNGGSLYESHLPINNQFFGYTKIYVMKNGQVHARSFGRITPGAKHSLSYVAATDTLTRLQYKANITWGKKVQSFNPVDSLQTTQ